MASFLLLDLNPGSTDWDDTINDYIKSDVSRIDSDQFAAIYDEERHKKIASYKELSEGLKAIDPVSGELGKDEL